MTASASDQLVAELHGRIQSLESQVSDLTQLLMEHVSECKKSHVHVQDQEPNAASSAPLTLKAEETDAASPQDRRLQITDRKSSVKSEDSEDTKVDFIDGISESLPASVSSGPLLKSRYTLSASSALPLASSTCRQGPHAKQEVVEVLIPPPPEWVRRRISNRKRIAVVPKIEERSASPSGWCKPANNHERPVVDDDVKDEVISIRSSPSVIIIPSGMGSEVSDLTDIDSDDDVKPLEQISIILPMPCERKPKKKKNALDFSLDSIRERQAGIPAFAIPPTPANIHEGTISRQYLANRFGGSCQATFQRPSAERIAMHGYQRFLCPNLDYNPECPQRPGEPGLFFTPGDGYDWLEEERLIVWVSPNRWQYLGQYCMGQAEALTTEEWSQLSENVRQTWVANLHCRGFGAFDRASIYLRRTLGREPKFKEINELRKKIESGKTHIHVSEAEIRAAFDKGEQVICVWTMTCVGYDMDFQRNLMKKYPAWVASYPHEEGNLVPEIVRAFEDEESDGESDDQEGARPLRPVKRKAPRKAQRRSVYSSSDDDSDGSIESGRSSGSERESYPSATYRARGTKSRPSSKKPKLEDQ